MNVVGGWHALRNRRNLARLRAGMASFLREVQGAPILYYPNPGNAGDATIAVATLAAFRRHGIAARSIEVTDPVDGAVVFLGGGGNFVPLYHQIRAAFDAFLGRAHRLVLLPHTIRGNEATLARLDRSCTIFCRDEVSHRHVRAVRSDLDVRLAHDMAFHLDAAAFLRAEDVRARAEPFWREKLRRHGLGEGDLGRAAGLDLSRLDVESRAAKPRSDLDISDVFTTGTSPAEAPIGAWCFLKTISLARHVTTDRLHVAIGAALLGVPCTLRDNSYGKNSAVYRFSLEGRFAKLRFDES